MNFSTKPHNCFMIFNLNYFGTKFKNLQRIHTVLIIFLLIYIIQWQFLSVNTHILKYKKMCVCHFVFSF